MARQMAVRLPGREVVGLLRELACIVHGVGGSPCCWVRAVWGAFAGLLRRDVEAAAPAVRRVAFDVGLDEVGFRGASRIPTCRRHRGHGRRSHRRRRRSGGVGRVVEAESRRSAGRRSSAAGGVEGERDHHLRGGRRRHRLPPRVRPCRGCRDPARVAAVVDVALAAVDVTAMVFVMNGGGWFHRRPLLAEARRHLALVLRGRRREPGLDNAIVDAARATHCLDISEPKTLRGRMPAYHLYTTRWSPADLEPDRRPRATGSPRGPSPATGPPPGWNGRRFGSTRPARRSSSRTPWSRPTGSAAWPTCWTGWRTSPAPPGSSGGSPAAPSQPRGARGEGGGRLWTGR